MFKIKLLIIFYFIAFGCAPAGRTIKSTIGISEAYVREMVKKTAMKNLTNSGFFIQRGKIITVSQNSRIGLFFTMKYSTGGKYLISLKSRTGMEAFRVYLAGDTILVNDRLNRNLLYGKPQDFERVSGIPAELLKISVGDIFINKPENDCKGDCNTNEIKLSDYYLGLVINSTVDCIKQKMKTLRISSGGPENFITVNYLKNREDNYAIPKKIEINDAGRQIRIIITIDKYVAPWTGEIEFVPGTGYTRKPLL